MTATNNKHKIVARVSSTGKLYETLPLPLTSFSPWITVPALLPDVIDAKAATVV